jgi:hypothetical protein
VALGAGGKRLRKAVKEDLALYAQVPVFGRMFAQAGHPMDDGRIPDSLLDSLVVWGDEEEVAAQLTDLLELGIDELMVSRIPETRDRRQEEALLRILASVSFG